MSIINFFSNQLSFNSNKLYEFYATTNPNKAKDIKKQQEAQQERRDYNRLTNVTYDLVKQAEAKAKLDVVAKDVEALRRNPNGDPRRNAKKIEQLINKIGYYTEQYIKAGGGRKDLIPEGEPGYKPLEIDPEKTYAADVTSVKLNAMTTFFVGDDFGKLAQKLSQDLDSVLKTQETRANLRQDQRSLTAIKDARDVMARLKDEFSKIRGLKIAVDITV